MSSSACFVIAYTTGAQKMYSSVVKNDTELSEHIWQLKGNEQRFTIKWKILAKAKPYSNLTKRCNLCTTEKHFIITKPELTDNIKQTKRSNFYMPAPSKVHPQI